MPSPKHAKWVRISQVFDFAVGEVVDSMFYRLKGFAPNREPAGVRVPLIHLVIQEAAKPRGRPRTAGKNWGTDLPATCHAFSAYGVDAKGRWWNVLYTPGRDDARARSVARPPYAALRKPVKSAKAPGMLRNHGHMCQLQERAQAALAAAELDMLRARCALI